MFAQVKKLLIAHYNQDAYTEALRINKENTCLRRIHIKDISTEYAEKLAPLFNEFKIPTRHFRDIYLDELTKECLERLLAEFKDCRLEELHLISLNTETTEYALNQMRNNSISKLGINNLDQDSCAQVISALHNLNQIDTLILENLSIDRLKQLFAAPLPANIQTIEIKRLTTGTLNTLYDLIFSTPSQHHIKKLIFRAPLTKPQQEKFEQEMNPITGDKNGITIYQTTIKEKITIIDLIEMPGLENIPANEETPAKRIKRE